MRISIHDLRDRRTEHLDGDPDHLEGLLAQRFPEACCELDPESEDLQDLVEHLNRSLDGYSLEVVPVDLQKVQRAPTFPKLGIEDRREVQLVGTQRQLDIQRAAVRNANQLAGAPAADSTSRGHRRGYSYMAAFPEGTVRVGYALGHPFRQGRNAPLATQQHEGLHMMLDRVTEQHGPEARTQLGKNLYRAIPRPYRQHVDQLQETLAGQQYAGTPHEDEEKVARLLNYANDPEERDAFHRALGHEAEERHQYGAVLKRALQAVRSAAREADESWFRPNPTRKAEPEPAPIIQKAEPRPVDRGPEDLWDPDKNENLLEDMLGFAPQASRVFDAAAFLAGGQPARLDAVREAIRRHGGDLEAAALAAYGLGVCEANRKAIRGVQSLHKSVPPEIGAPEVDVEALTPDAAQAAAQVRLAFQEGDGDVRHVELGGRHSAGTMLTSHGGQHYLLKPGSGDQSPAAGAKEEPASQSRREAAFWHVADLLGLGQYVPRADLLAVDGREVAAIEMLPPTWRGASKLDAEDHEKLVRALERYRPDGTLCRWATLDFLAGQTDRHNQNMMISPRGEVKLIDHGSAFAGPSFDPARDDNSFIPFYLRARAGGQKLAEMPPQDRLRFMPTCRLEVDRELADWIRSVDQGRLGALLVSYGIAAAPTLGRLAKLQRLPAQGFSEAVNALWAT